ncbi:MAG: hypothetical protein KAG18_08270 [Sinobacterium sp.]|nr:hypothetical protein [Sinobacterium sp.]
MSVTTDAVFFLNKSDIAEQMLISEFEALLDAVVQMPDYSGQSIDAVHLQITDHLLIKSAIFFHINFDEKGDVVSDWNVPFNQLLQSAARGPDLGAGVIRLVTESQCSAPWLASMLFDPEPEIFKVLTNTVKANKLGVLESDHLFASGNTAPILQPSTAPVLPVDTSNIPTLQPASVPTAKPQVSSDEHDTSMSAGEGSQEFQAMKHALTAKYNRLKKDYDALQAKSRSTVTEVKLQAKEHLEHVLNDSMQDNIRKDQQLLSLKQQLQHEQSRYHDLKELQVEQVAGYQSEREDMLDQLEEGQTLEVKKISALKTAFTREIDARIEAETTKLNEQLAIREVELFYREEQVSVLEDESKHLKEEKQLLLTESGNRILKKLEDNGVTFVVYHVGVGHITLALEDVGRYLDERHAYLAERCGVSAEVFMQWDEHFNQPVCGQVDDAGVRCTQQVSRVEWAASFEKGKSDRCIDHQ